MKDDDHTPLLYNLADVLKKEARAYNLEIKIRDVGPEYIITQRYLSCR